ncbi:MAG: hypothetical protein AAFR83_25830, partial [Cyanobacteria bacterium J06629_18]
PPPNFDNFFRGFAENFEKIGPVSRRPAIRGCDPTAKRAPGRRETGVKTPIFFKIFGKTPKKIIKILGCTPNPQSHKNANLLGGIDIIVFYSFSGGGA